MDNIKESFKKIADKAKTDQVELEMMVIGGDSLVLGYQKQKINKYQSNTRRVAGFRVLVGPSQGYAWTENLQADALERCYQEALLNAKMVPAKGPVLTLPENADLSDNMEDLSVREDVAIEDKLKVAERLEAEVLKADDRIQNVPYSGFNESFGWKRILNSKGLDRTYKYSSYTGYTYGLAKSGDSTKMGGEGFFVRRFKDLDISKVVSKSVENAVSRLGATRPSTGNYPVILERGEVAATFISMLESYLSAQGVLEGHSLFKDQLHQVIASEKLSLLDDPFDRRGVACRPFDDEGSPSQKIPLIEKGVLKNFFTNLELAGKLNLPHTASAQRSPASEMQAGSTNLFVQKGQEDREDMLQAPRTILITEISGGLHAGFKEASGDFSLPVEGFLYENGQRKGPLEQFVISGNIATLIKNIIMVGKEYDPSPGQIFSPDLLIKELSVAGA